MRIALVLLLALVAFVSCSCAAPGPSISARPFGGCFLYTLENRNGVRACITNYGATLVSLETPDRDGRLGNIVLGFRDLDGYLGEHPYFGSAVGRYANRIAGGRFMVDGTAVQLATNNGPNHLHGGINGFNRVVWAAEPFLTSFGPGLRLRHTSPDHDEGYPGEVEATVVYTLTHDDELMIDFTATTTAPTAVNLTHHSYFNLDGPGLRDVLSHEIQILADRYLPTDETLIPTGELRDVKGTPFDLRLPQRIGDRKGEIVGPQFAGGYDHCFALSGYGQGAEPFLAARLRAPVSGRTLEVWTTEPGLQLYTGNFLDGTIVGAEGVHYHKHAGLCLEPQRYPDSVNRPEFPTAFLRPGETYRHTTIYRFGAE